MYGEWLKEWEKIPKNGFGQIWKMRFREEQMAAYTLHINVI
jgi:hypothetical protein